MHLVSFFFSLAVWCAIAWNEGAVDAYDYARRRMLKNTSAEDSIYGNLVRLFKYRSTKKELQFSWIVRIGTYIALFFWKAYCLIKLNNLGVFSPLDYKLILSSVVFVPILLFPFFYYSKYCEKIKRYDNLLAPKGWMDNLQNNGGVLIKFRYRILMLIIGLIGLTIQILIISNVRWFH